MPPDRSSNRRARCTRSATWKQALRSATRNFLSCTHRFSKTDVSYWPQGRSGVVRTLPEVSLRFSRGDKGESGVFLAGSVAGIPGLKSETWGTLRVHPLIFTLRVHP